MEGFQDADRRGCTAPTMQGSSGDKTRSAKGDRLDKIPARELGHGFIVLASVGCLYTLSTLNRYFSDVR
jgi:hypothetical protein